MTSNGALPRRDSCDFMLKSDDAAKKCVQKKTLDESVEVPSFKTESYGLPITFASPRSHEAFLDYMAATIQTKDLGTCRILIICQQNSEAQRVKSEMGMRNINTMLLDEDHQMTRHMVRLWSEGYIQQPVIVCDEYLKLFEGCAVEVVMHTSLPPVSKFKTRIQELTKLKIGNKTEILAFTTTTGSNEENLNQPKISNKKNKGKRTPKLVVKPLKMNPEENPSETASSSSQKVENQPVNYPLMGLNGASKEMFPKPPLFPLDDDYPSSSARPSSSSLQMAEPAEDVRSLPEEDERAEGPETPESDGWETPPEAEIAHSVLIDSYARRLEAILRARNPVGMDTSSAPPSSIDSLLSITGQSSRGISSIAPEEERMTRVQFGVLARSRELLIQCYDITGVPELNPLIKDAMRTLDIGNSRARGLQRFAWPHVSSGKSLVAVGQETVGKTWCFLPSLCQRTHEQLLRTTEDHYGPTSIVVCSNQQQGNQMLQWIIKLLDALPGVPIPCERVVTLWEKGNAQEVASRLSHGTVGILVTTPDMLLLLKEWHSAATPLFDSKSVKCLALDNFSDMLRQMPHTTAKMVDWITHLLDFHADGCQLLITTRLWVDTCMHRKLLPLVPDVLILFKDALEASVYGGVSLEMSPTKAGEEARSLVQLLRGRSLDEERIVVVCQDKAEALELKRTLAEEDLRAEAIYLESGLSAVTRWRQRNPASVLLVTDYLVEKLKCGPVDLLIHYSPGPSWQRFKFRFCLFYENYASSAPDRNAGKSIVLLRKFDLDRIWLLCDFVKWHRLPRQDCWVDFLAERRIKMEKMDSELAKLPLCDQLTSYGTCTRRTCRYRHVMLQEEVQPPANYPTKGEIRFQVLTCNSPAHIAVRLNDLYPTKVAFLNTPMTKLGEALQLHYEQEKNRRKHEKPKPGDIVIIKNMKRYERAVITSIDENGRKLQVRLLDSGIDVLTWNPSQIFICDQAYQKEPNQAMEVRLLGIEPDECRMDRIWTSDVRNVVRHKFFSRLQGGRTKIFTAYVEFVIARTIFVRTVVDDEGHDLRTFVMKRLQAHEDEEAMEKLKQVVNRAVSY